MYLLFCAEWVCYVTEGGDEQGIDGDVNEGMYVYGKSECRQR